MLKVFLFLIRSLMWIFFDFCDLLRNSGHSLNKFAEVVGSYYFCSTKNRGITI